MPPLAPGPSTLAHLPLVMTADEAAPVLRTSGRHVRRLIRDGKLDPILIEIGGRQRISRHLLERWLDGGADPP